MPDYLLSGHPHPLQDGVISNLIDFGLSDGLTVNVFVESISQLSSHNTIIYILDGEVLPIEATGPKVSDGIGAALREATRVRPPRSLDPVHFAAANAVSKELKRELNRFRNLRMHDRESSDQGRFIVVLRKIYTGNQGPTHDLRGVAYSATDNAEAFALHQERVFLGNANPEDMADRLKEEAEEVADKLPELRKRTLELVSVRRGSIGRCCL